MANPEKDDVKTTENSEPEEVQEVEATCVEDSAQVVEEDVVEEELSELDKALTEVEEWKDRYMRLQAEWDTYRRRMAEQRQEEKLRATENMVKSLIPVIDDFERTINYANTNGEEGLFDGVVAVHSKMLNVLISDGVEVLNPEQEAFNALEAQAVGTVEDDSVPEETVIDVFQKGYKMGIKVLRPAMVRVSTGGPRREVEDEQHEE